MKKTLSLCLLAVVSISAVSPVFSQKIRRISPVKNEASNASTQFESVQAFSDGEGVLVEWEMKLEVNNGGFLVYRIDESGRHKVSPSLITGSAFTYGSDPTSGEKYSFFDASGNSAAAYSIVTVNLNGSTGASDTFTPLHVNDLREVSGSSSNRLISDTRTAKTALVGNELLLDKTLAGEISANAVQADLDTHRWAISQPGVKIGIRNEGLYRISRNELQAGGFNVGGDPNLWQLYVEGVEQAMLIGPNADYIEFYGKGIDRVESDTNIYYLVTGPNAGKRVQSRVARPAGTVTPPSYRQTFQQKERTNYVSNILNGEAENYWGQAVISVEDTNFNFNLTGVDFTSVESTMELKFQGFSFDPHIVNVTLNGEVLAPTTGTSRNAFSKQYAIPTSLLREGANTLKFRSGGVFADFSFFDSVSISFARKHLAVQNRLSFFTQNYRRAKLEGFTSSNIRVFDTTVQNSPVLISNLTAVQEGSTFGVTLPAERGRLLYAVENTGLLQATSITANDPSLLGNTSNGANLVIISHKDFMTQAENWASYRRGQGFTVKVVEVSEVYDEFNFGVSSSNSIENFLQYAVNNWQIAPQYVLLVGDASIDPRNYEGFGYLNLVPSRIVNTIFTETGSDDALADFNNDGLSEIAIGRIPARTGQAVTNALAKVVAFEQTVASPLQRGALFAYDVFDSGNNYNFQQMSTRIRNQLPISTPITMIGRGDTPAPPNTPQTLLLNAINSGKYVINYSGHGTSGAWASSSFFSNIQVPQLTNANNQSIFTMLTCLNGYFMQPNRISLAETLLDATNGGAVAAWASTGETTPDVQEIMATRFYLKLGQGSISRLGDLIRDAKTSIPGGSDVRLSWALLGDPMLKVREPLVGDRQAK